MAFWAAIFALGIGGEVVALETDRSADPFSVTVWWVLGLHPTIRCAGMAAFVAGAVWLFRHFFLRAP